MSKTLNEALPKDLESDDPFCIFTPEYMEGCSDFPNFASFIEQSPWKIQKGDIVNADGSPVMIEQMNAYLSEHCRFHAWAEFVDHATDSWNSDVTPDERAKKRRDCEIKPVYIEHSLEEGQGVIVDISVRGVGLRAKSLSLPAGGWAKITVPERESKKVKSLPNHELVLRGLIRWSAVDGPETRVGVELTARLM